MPSSVIDAVMSSFVTPAGRVESVSTEKMTEPVTPASTLPTVSWYWPGIPATGVQPADEPLGSNVVCGGSDWTIVTPAAFCLPTLA